MHKAEYVRGYEMYEILLNFEIQTDHRFPVRRPDIVLITNIKRNCYQVGSAVPTDIKWKINE